MLGFLQLYMLFLYLSYNIYSVASHAIGSNKYTHINQNANINARARQHAYTYSIPSCKTCKWYIPQVNMSPFCKDDLGLCGFYKNKYNYNNIEVYIYEYAKHCRNNDNLCGRLGYLYESAYSSRDEYSVHNERSESVHNERSERSNTDNSKENTLDDSNASVNKNNKSKFVNDVTE
jgi:hypothetical protein